MNKFEGTYQHPLIVCTHQLDISYIETFGEELSNKLQLNVEMNDDFLIKKTIYHNVATKNAQLRVIHSVIIPAIRYHLRFDEVLLIIYDDIFEIKFDITLDYFHLLRLYERNELKKIQLFETFFKQLKSLGIDEVHFGIFAEFEKDEGVSYCWENIYRIMTKCENYFKLEI